MGGRRDSSSDRGAVGGMAEDGVRGSANSDGRSNGNGDGLANGSKGSVRPLVMKFGGTSVGKGERMLAVAAIVRKSLSDGDCPIVVVSAMSTYVKDEGTTARLLDAANKAMGQDAKGLLRVINKLKTSHVVAIHECMGETEESQALQEEINEDIDRMRLFLEALQVIGELSPRSRDVIMGLGERLSAKIFAAVLRSKGLGAQFITLENVLERPQSGTAAADRAPEVNAEFYSNLRDRITASVRAATTAGARGSTGSASGAGAWTVPVVTGFFGFVPSGMLEVIGRGYTDFTAALIAAGVNARELQIWKEVDGIYSADPRRVPDAHVLARISPEEAAQLSFFGSEVIHPFSMQQVVREKIPIRIKNTFKPDQPGTVIDPCDELVSHADLAMQLPAGTSGGRSEAVAVTVKKGVTVLNITSDQKLASPGFFARVFQILRDCQLSIDMVSTSQVDISMTLAKTERLESALEQLRSCGDVTCKAGLAIVSIIGKRMKRSRGIAGHVFTVLALHHVNIEMISQGASEINIGCVVSMADADRAVHALHSDVICKPYNGLASPMLRSPKRGSVESNGGGGGGGGGGTETNFSADGLSPAAVAAKAAQRALQQMPPLSLTDELTG